MVTSSGERLERIPAYIRRAVQDLSKSPVYEGVFWYPDASTDPTEKTYVFKNSSPAKPKSLIIYESHGK